jgi:acyl-CoA synthetase (NDP forming)
LDHARTSLARFLAPRSIAVIGASPERGRIRGILLHNLRQNGYSGRIYPVNPSYAEIAGLRCYPDLAAIAAPVDLALIAIPAEHVLAALKACAGLGIPHALIISSGFAEEGGARRAIQAEIAALARQSGMRISGPNAEGFYNAIDQVAATFSPATDRATDRAPVIAGARRVGIIAQSGGIGFALYNRGRALGLPFSHVITTGNEADLTAADFFAHLAADPATGVILLFLESVRDGAGFCAAARRAAENGKKVIAVKVGQTAAGERASLSHTASIAGWRAAYDAAFASLGVIAARDPDEAVALAAAFATNPGAAGRRAGVITVSGGAGAWLADALVAAGLDMPEISPATQARIRGFIPSYGATANPVDITAQAAYHGGLTRTIAELMEEDGIDLIAVAISAASETRLSLDPPELASLLARRAKPVLLFSYTLPSDFARAGLAEAGAVVLTHLAALARAAALLADPPKPAPVPPTPRRLPAAACRALAGHAGTLAEYQAKDALAAAGFALAPRALAANLEAALAAARAIGFPLALKLQSPDLPHKSDIGGVRLGINDEAELGEAFALLLAAGRAAGARIAGVLVEKMALPGIEILLSAVRDPGFGPVVMLGAGGVMAEVFRDVTHRLAPLDIAVARAMIGELRSAPLLAGFRGAPTADCEALARLIVALGDFAAAAPPALREVELNPVIVHAAGAGCTIADALIILADAPEKGDRACPS